MTPEIKRAFRSGDKNKIRSVTGTAPKFQIGGNYRVVGTCRQKPLNNATLYLGNTAEAGSGAIAASAGTSHGTYVFEDSADDVSEGDDVYLVAGRRTPHLFNFSAYRLLEKANAGPMTNSPNQIAEGDAFEPCRLPESHRSVNVRQAAVELHR